MADEVARTKHPLVGQPKGDGVHILLLRRYCMFMPSSLRFELGPSPTFEVFRHILLLQRYTRPSSDELRQFLLETRVPSDFVQKQLDLVARQRAKCTGS